MILKFLSLLFRKFLISHHRSINFRAMVLAAMIAAKENVSQSDYAVITAIASEIYGKDLKRCNALLHFTRTYVNKILAKQKSLDNLLFNIDKELMLVHRYAKKIDFSHLRRLMIESDEEDIVTQQQVYEFMIDEVKRYSSHS